MKPRAFVTSLSLVGASLLLPPAGLAADCSLAMNSMRLWSGAARTYNLGGTLNVGLGDNNQNVGSLDGSYMFNDKTGARLGLGVCDIFDEYKFTVGARVYTNLYTSLDAKWDIQGSVGFNRTGINENFTALLVPLNVSLGYELTENWTGWGGPSLYYNRFSGSTQTFTSTDLGFNVGATFAPPSGAWSVKGGLDVQLGDSSNQWSFVTGVYLTPKQLGG